MSLSSKAPIIVPILLALMAEAPDPGRELLERSVAAHGGLERFRAIRDWCIVADRTNEIYEEYLLREGGLEKTLLVKKRQGSLLVYGHDGRRGFSVVERVARTDEAAAGEGYYRAHGEYYLRSLPFKWLDPGVRVEDAGSESAEGRELQLLRITAGENVGRAWKDVWVAAIDAETHLLYEARLTHHGEMESWMSPREEGTQEITYRYSDYRELGGLRIPFLLEYYSGGRKTGQNRIRTIELDTGLSEELFTPQAHERR